jgi:acetylornithine deacetylase/succinyl-diaminopimelate desuccinylase-like protein
MHDDPLASPRLMSHITALASGIGPRPAGQPAETAAHTYIRSELERAGIAEIEIQPIQTRPSIATAVTYPLGLALTGNLLGLFGRAGATAGGMMSLFAAYNLWCLFGGQRLPLEHIEPRQPSTNLIARLSPKCPPEQTVVLIGHVDTSKQRALQAPAVRHLMLRFGSIWLATILINGLSQLAQSAGALWIARLIQWASAALLASTLRQAWEAERAPYVAGANDNASAVACLLGIGELLQKHPLERTEVWLVFTGAEEVGCVGMQQFLDRYGQELRNAWFIDFEMVGAEQIAFVTHHSGLSYVNAYQPDDESLHWAQQTALAHPQLQVEGRAMVIMEEVGTLRGQGYRGLCIVGVGPDGWLANWHQESDTIEQIVPLGVERAARFGLALLQARDA